MQVGGMSWGGRPHGSVSFLVTIISVFASLVSGSLAFADSVVTESLPVTAKDDGELPPYTFNYANGLYATLVGYFSVPDIELKQVREYKLKVESFKKRITVRAILQSEPAPLVVVLQGIDGRAEGRLGKLWPSWFSDAGYNVLTFDSTFLPGFTDVSGHGVTGNVVAESERIAAVIDAFLDTDDIKSKVTKIGVVGMSYGGLEALVLGKMAQENKLKFKLDGIQAYSPPIKLQKTGELIDQWYREDRWQYTLAELSNKISGHKPVGPNDPPPFSDSVMRAAIAAVFRMGLADVVMRNDKDYKLHLLPSGNTFDDQYVKEDYAATWGFSRFMTDMAYPYWQKKLNLNSFNELMEPMQLCNLMPKQPACTQIIIAEDDPFNTAEDTASIKACAGLSLTVLPHGGHLGFVNDPWTKAKLLALFKSGNKQALNK